VDQVDAGGEGALAAEVFWVGHSEVREAVPIDVSSGGDRRSKTVMSIGAGRPPDPEPHARIDFLVDIEGPRPCPIAEEHRDEPALPSGPLAQGLPEDEVPLPVAVEVRHDDDGVLDAPGWERNPREAGTADRASDLFSVELHG